MICAHLRRSTRHHSVRRGWIRAFASAISESSEAPDTVVDHIVVGGGVVGLAIAERLARFPERTTFVLERHGSAGQENSSRNSEVIHGGINHYPPLKQALCLKGRDMLYRLSKEKNIPCKNLQKFVVATNAHQVKELEKQHEYCSRPDVGAETYLMDGAEAMRLEPDLYAEKVLVSPTTGIVSSHAFMQYLESSIQEAHSSIIFHTTVTGIKAYKPSAHALGPFSRGLGRFGSGYLLECVTEKDESPHTILAKVVVNSAGLGAEKLASMVLAPEDVKRQHYVKGSYFDYHGPGVSKVQRLLYPVPEVNHAGLGTHLTKAMDGSVRFGPDVRWLDENENWRDNLLAPDDEENLDLIYRDVKKYLPGIVREGLTPAYAGIRPKISEPGQPPADFWIDHPKAAPGFINLQGIESPGLTGSLAIAEHVGRMVQDYWLLSSNVGDVNRLEEWA